MEKTKSPNPCVVILLILIAMPALCCIGFIGITMLGNVIVSSNPSRAFTPTSEEATATLRVQYTNTPEVTPSPTSQPTPSAIPTPIIDVTSILGKSVSEVESILGETTERNPITDPGDKLSGGEYRDYRIDKYDVFIAYDSNRIARVFQVLDGLSDENFSTSDWNIILLRFGMNVTMEPSREAPAAVYWDNYRGYFIAVAASSSRGYPVWTVQIAQAGYGP